MLLRKWGRFVDARRTYSLSLVDAQLTSMLPEALADDGPRTRRQLRSLAWQSAEFSRYRVDPDMPSGSWRRMYSAWIENGLNCKLVDVVLIEHEAANEKKDILLV